MLDDSLSERDFELAAVREALTDAANGIGSILIFDAPAGLGKTALIRQARAEARRRGFTVLSAGGARSETDFDFGVVRQLFEPALPKSGPHRARLPTAPAMSGSGGTGDRGHSGAVAGADSGSGPGGARAESRSEFFNSLYHLLLDLAERAPAVVLVDDVQWVDAPSASFLGFLARRVESAGIALFVAARSSRRQHDESLDEILSAAETRLLRPRELSYDAVAVLVRRELGGEGSAEFCDACHRVTGGKPLFVRELLRLLAARGVRSEADCAGAALAAGPDAVRHHVIAALRRPPGAALSVAGAVAVLGDGTSLARIAEHCGLPLPATAAVAEQLVRAGVFERADPPAIRYDAVRDVVLSLTPRPESAPVARAGVPRALPAPLRDRAAAPRARAEQDTLDSFTPAEREVAALVIKGLTNRQVARHLFLSEKTVEAHLSRAYRKAGVRSRTQLTARLSALAMPAVAPAAG